MTQLSTIALIALGLRFPYLGVSMLCIYIAYAKPDLLPIVTMVILYGMYKIAFKVIKSISKDNIINN